MVCRQHSTVELKCPSKAWKPLIDILEHVLLTGTRLMHCSKGCFSGSVFLCSCETVSAMCHFMSLSSSTECSRIFWLSGNVDFRHLYREKVTEMYPIWELLRRLLNVPECSMTFQNIKFWHFHRQTVTAMRHT